MVRDQAISGQIPHDIAVHSGTKNLLTCSFSSSSLGGWKAVGVHTEVKVPLLLTQHCLSPLAFFTSK